MLKTKITFSILATVLAATLSFSSFATTPAYAADAPTDLSVTSLTAAAEQLYSMFTCNEGSTTVKSITYERTFTNYSPTRSLSLPSGFFGINATDSGTYDDETRTWTGTLDAGQCINIGFAGDITGANGEVVTFNSTIVSSVLSDDSANVDPVPGNDTSDYTSAVLADRPDITIGTRLLTSGTITTGSEVSYEITLTNDGPGAYIVSPGKQLPLGIYFVMPVGSVLDGIADDDLGDGLVLDDVNCFEAPTSAIGPGVDDFYPGVVAGCSMINNSFSFEPGASYTFTATFTAGASFASGSTSVWAIAVSENPQSMFFQVDAATGVDAFASSPSNVNNLVYDGDELQVTVNRCPGQGATTTNGTGCFRVSFNKLIWEPSFTIDDLILSGGGTVDSLTKIDDFNWEVRISGIPLNTTVSLTLEEDGVQDFSAIANGVEVLGENVIRYELATAGTDGSASGAASGTLPATGGLADFSTPVLLLALGLMLVGFSRARRQEVQA